MAGAKVILVAALVPLALAGCAGGRAPALADRFAVGRDATGEPCVANRNWNDPQLGGPFDQAYALGCRGVAASRPLGSVAAVLSKAAKPEDAAQCGAPAAMTFAGTEVQARRCFDKALGAQTVVVRFVRGERTYRGSAIPTVVTPMETALRALAGLPLPAAGATPTPGLAFDSLAPAPAVEQAGGYDAGFDAQIALREGIVLNRQGLYVEASRVLNDALSRLPAGALPGTRAELSLEAGLADSNIRFNDAADEHFGLATTLLNENPNVDRAPFLQQKLATYRALDRLNRRDWNAALKALDVKLGPQGSLLENGALLADLNQAPRNGNDASSVVGGPSAAELSQYVINAQRYWAASVAYLARGGTDAVAQSQAALDTARDNMAKLLAGRIDPASVLWLIAQIERQGGRLDARRAEADQGTGKDAAYAMAVARFDCALAALEGQRPSASAEGSCVIRLDDAARARLANSGMAAGSGPISAETQMERAALLRRKGVSNGEVLADYNEAVDSLIASSRAGGGVPYGLVSYLDLLTEEAKTNPSSDAAERFFRAVQAIGEPAIARQMSQLQSVVTAGGTTAAKVRDRTELGRQIAGLRYAIAGAADQPTKDKLEAERADKERQLLAVEADLASDTKFRAIDDRPVTVADVQAALKPGEVYLKLVELSAKTYGIVVGKDQVQIYPLAATARELAQLAGVVRRSIRDESDSRIPFFQVGAARGLFQLITGPAEAQVNAAKAIVIDPAGPLTNLPVGVLVTDTQSVRAYAATRKTAGNDYSKVSFLAGQADISTALSPRSFLIARGLKESTARNAFIGFGEHAPPPPVEVASRGPVSLGLGCPIEFTELARVFRENEPISAQKITIAADALGVPNAPRMTGQAFTDTAVASRPDLDQYQVLHFATHGLPETQVGCADIPPSLVTSVGASPSDGFLSFAEIAGMRLDANLVVLSACETSSGVSGRLARSTGQEEEGKSLEGLVRAFLTANARAVLATYWKVSVEGESDQLFRAFYTAGRTESIGDALRTAQTGLMRNPRYSHPYYWGAYFVVGDSSKTMLTPKAG